LAGFDVTDRLREIEAPVLAVAGSHDVPTPPECLKHIASEVKHGRLVVLDGVGHLAPAEAPARVAELIREHLGGPADRPATTSDDVYAAGMAVRREVLGDAHVDRAVAATTDFTAEFQRLITEYAWGTIWTRQGLDKRSRSLITLTALVARGHHEELKMHLRAARRNGLTNDEIKELLMQTAIYCGVPDANTAFRIAAEVLPGFDDDKGKRP
jgi:3-oxoadipate enol-lactonase / 4-carboxymuconolactone decarboxylase